MPPKASTNPPKSVVDRSVVIVLSNPDDTGSKRQGVSVQVERTHRLYGTSLLAAAAQLMTLNASTYATACTIFHRFYYRVSLTRHCVWSVAMASMLLATKVEDGPQQRTIRNIIVVFDHLYRKRRGCIPETTDPQHRVLPLNKLGPVWKEYYQIIIETEKQIMREMGFVFYFIPDSHPHKFLWEFIRVIFGFEKLDPAQIVSENSDEKETSNEKRHSEMAQRAWNYCNDSCRLDLCVRFQPEVITCAAIHLAAIDMKLALPVKPQPWWGLILSSDNEFKQLATAANAILGILESERNDPSFKNFLPSLVEGGSFNDKDSFLWESRE